MSAEQIPETLTKLAVPVDGLKHYGKNPRRGDVKMISESLEHHGQYKPIVVRTGTNEVLAGNHTLKAAADKLKDDSYAVFIVGAVRNKRGHLMDMRSLMVRAAGAAGLTLHQDAILVTSVGSVAVRAGRSFLATRVLSRTHQDVLIFLKGDRKRAATRMGEVDAQASLEALEATEIG